MSFSFGNISINTKPEQVAVQQKPVSKYEKYSAYFDLAKKLCIQAYKCNKITTIAYFVENGIPQEFMNKIWEIHLIGGGKNGSNIMWNWDRNYKYPNITITNFLRDLKEHEETT